MYPYYYNPFSHAYYQPAPQQYCMANPSQLFDYYANAVQQAPLNENKKPQEVNTAFSTARQPVKEEHFDPPQQIMPSLREKEPSKLEKDIPKSGLQARQTTPKKQLKTQRKKKKTGAQVRRDKPRYVHKNFESNMIHKIFFFLWTEDKSARYVRRMLGSEERVGMYYEYIKVLRRFSKRYINKEYLLDLCNYSEGHIAYCIVEKKVNSEVLTMADFGMVMRRLIDIYLRGESINSILTSKKMNRGSWKDHFLKARTIQGYLFKELHPRIYDQQITESYTELHQLLAEESA